MIYLMFNSLKNVFIKTIILRYVPIIQCDAYNVEDVELNKFYLLATEFQVKCEFFCVFHFILVFCIVRRFHLYELSGFNKRCAMELFTKL